MRRNARRLFALLALLFIGAGVLQIRVVTYPPYLSEPAARAKAEFAPLALPTVDSFRSPHAILVLDVSASMRRSDPERYEYEAARQFYTVYRDLSKETLRKGDSAHIAVILFSTLAQIVDWDGDRQAWLPVDDAHTGQFLNVLQRFLGNSGRDPRIGSDTDYLAALDEVQGLVHGLPSPPAVVMLTDGKNDPHPLFSPVGTPQEHRTRYPVLWEQNRKLLEYIQAGRYQFVNGKTGEIFNRVKARIRDVKLTPEQVSASNEAVRKALAELRRQRFFLSLRQPAVPLTWQALFLGKDEAREARGDLGGDESSLVAVHDPRALPGEFIQALSTWLHLAPRDLPTGAKSLQVPTDTQAFALVMETTGKGERVLLRSGAREVKLAGANGVWAGVARGGGDWEIRTNAGTIRRGRIYLRPRYEWVLHAPLRQTIARVNEPVKLEMYLLSVDTGGAVVAHSIYPHLPADLPMTVQVSGGGNIDLVMARSNAPDVAYSAEFSAPAMATSVNVEVDLQPLREMGITIPTSKLKQRIELRPNLRVVVTTSSGKETAIEVNNAPTEAARIRRILGGAVK